MAALVVVVLVANLSMMFVHVALSKNKEQRQSVDSKRAFYMAEAGLTEGYMGLYLGKSGNVASADVPAQFGNGLFWTVATELGGGRVQLESTGLCGAGRAKLSVTVERTSATIASLGFFGSQAITVESGGLIDSYDSRLGPYVAPIGSLLTTGSKIGSNADVTVRDGTLLNPTRICGDATPGPRGTVFRGANTQILGSTAPRAVLATLPAVVLPAVPAERQVDTQDCNTVLTLPAGMYGIKAFNVRRGGDVTVQGPASVVLGDLTVRGGGTLRLDAHDGPIKLFVTGKLQLDRNSNLSTLSTDPFAVTIQLADTATAAIGATGNFHGSLYAPNADIVLPSSFTVFGSVVSKTLTIGANGKLHFDSAFASGSNAGLAGTPTLLGWHIVELPNVPAVNLRFDAVTALRMSGKVPLDPKDSHLDIGESVDALLDRVSRAGWNGRGNGP